MKLFTAVLFIGLAPVLAVAQRSTQLSSPQPMMRESPTMRESPIMSESRSSSFSSERTSSFSSEPRTEPTVSHERSVQSAPELSGQSMANHELSIQAGSDIRVQPMHSESLSDQSELGNRSQPAVNNWSIVSSARDFIAPSDRSKFVDDALNYEDNEIRHFQDEQRLERESQIKSMATAPVITPDQPTQIVPSPSPFRPIMDNVNTVPASLDFVPYTISDEKSRMAPLDQCKFNVICYIWEQRLEREREIRSQGIMYQWDSLRHLNHLKVPY
jgi:hypothetical protein